MRVLPGVILIGQRSKECSRMRTLKPLPFEKLIIWKGSRIARNVEDRLACQSLLAKKGIDIISVKEPEFEGSIKVLMLPIMAAIDEYQSYIIGEDTLRGMKTLTRQGYSAGGKPPKGYRTHREVVGIKKEWGATLPSNLGAGPGMER